MWRVGEGMLGASCRPFKLQIRLQEMKEIKLGISDVLCVQARPGCLGYNSKIEVYQMYTDHQLRCKTSIYH